MFFLTLVHQNKIMAIMGKEKKEWEILFPKWDNCLLD